MEFIPQKIPEIIVISPIAHGDSRGYFSETYRQDLLNDTVGEEIHFVQDNESRSARGVLRGLHFQMPPYAQSKLVRVIEGAVLDVVVDIRHGSPTYGEHVSVTLSAENRYQLWVPRGFAHGFVVLSSYATFLYKVDNYYVQSHDRGLAFDDPALQIDWQLPVEALQLSQKDRYHPLLRELPISFQYGEHPYG